MTATVTRHDAAHTPTAYSFGSGQPSGVWLGLGLLPVCLVGVALLLGMLALTAGVPLPLAVGPVLLAALVAVVPVRGRSLLAWLTPATAHVTGTATGDVRWTAALSSCAPTDPPQCSSSLRLPAEFGRLRLHPGCDDQQIGVIADHAGRTVTVVFAVAGVDRFPLLDSAEQDHLLANWGQALAVLADTEPQLARLQMIDRATPGDVTDVDAGASPDDLERTVAELAVRHDTLLAAQWRLPRTGPVLDGFVTAGRCRSILAPLLSAQLVARPLTLEETATRLADVFTHRTTAGHVSRVGPMSRRADWTNVRTDDTWHRSLVVNRWPASPVGSGWLTPLLVAATPSVTRTVALHLHRIDPSEAQRLARAARARAQLDRVDRARLGLTATAAVDKAEAAGVGMDEELAAGFRTHRLAGIITISAADLPSLDEATQATRQAAAAARLELSPLHGQHQLALAATAPLCRLRSRSQR